MAQATGWKRKKSNVKPSFTDCKILSIERDMDTVSIVLEAMDPTYGKPYNETNPTIIKIVKLELAEFYEFVSSVAKLTNA